MSGDPAEAAGAATAPTPESSRTDPDPPPSREGPSGDGWQRVRRQLEEATRGEFEVLEVLGKGGMARVFLARDLALDRRVAIKVMAPGLLMGPGMVDRFRREAVTVANLHHPNIITIHTVRQAGNLHFFVMQVVDGASLEDILARPGSIPIHLVQAIVYQLGVGLSYAHRRGVIHRDIKPANVLMDRDGHAVLTDFGIAMVTTDARLTQTGSTIGTPSYMSPEQCRAEDLTGASDQYALGVLAYEMLTGSPPFSGSPFEIMQGHTATPPPSIVARRPDCPAEVEAAVLRMLAKSPDDRFPTVADAVEAMGGYLPGPSDPARDDLVDLVKGSGAIAITARPPRTPTPGRATPLPGPPPEAPGTGRRRIVWAAGAVAVLAVAAAGIASLGSGADEGRPADPDAPDLAAAPLPPATIRFPEPSQEVLVGRELTVRAEIVDTAGGVVVDAPVTWRSSDPRVAEVEGTGAEVLVAGLAPGSAEITAATGGVEGSFRVVVDEPAAGELRVQAPRSQVVVGESVRLTAVLTDPTGAEVPDAEVAWSSSDPAIAEVDAGSGLATGARIGRVRITARSGEQTGAATLAVVGRVDSLSVVTPPGPLTVGQTAVARADLTARPDDYAGPDGVVWNSSNPAVAAVSYAAGDSVVLTLLGPGQAVVEARAGTARNASTLQVEAPRPATSLELTPGAVSFRGMEDAESPPAQRVRVAVSGADAPRLGPVRYGDGAEGWLEPDLEESGGGAWTLTLAVATGDMAQGSYTARVPVVVGEEERTVAVALGLEENPATAPLVPGPEAERGINALLADYLAAVNGRNAARIRALFPSIPQGAIDDLLELRESDTYVLQLVAGSLRPGEGERTLEGDVLATVLERGRSGESFVLVYTFSRGEDGWFIVSQRADG
jgi:serine/threonine-protein kinase